MPEEYEALLEELKGTGIPFEEYGWKTSPAGDYGVVSFEFEVGVLEGNDEKQYRSFQGSVDLFYRALALRETDILKGDRICQFRIFQKMPPVILEERETLSDPDRGGFGSTGV